MAVNVSTSTVINRPISEVAAFATDPDNATTWYDNIKSVEWETEPPYRVGSRVAFGAKMLGRPIAYTYEVKELVPGSKLVMRTSDGPFPMETTYQWQSLGENSTRMTIRNRGKPPGIGNIISPLMGMAVKRANKKDLARLKEILESRRD